MLLGIVMVIIAFGFKSFKYTFNNFFYLMILSIILGGGLYLLNVSRGYSNSGLVFFTNGKKSNLFILLIVSVIILFFYVRKLRKNKDIDLRYKVQLYDNGKVVDLVGFLDTGNCLSDPFFKKPILIINKGNYSFSGKKILVPFNTINGDSIMECFIVDKVYISNRGFFNKVLVGISPEKFKISGIDIILKNGVNSATIKAKVPQAITSGKSAKYISITVLNPFIIISLNDGAVEALFIALFKPKLNRLVPDGTSSSFK